MSQGHDSGAVTKKSGLKLAPPKGTSRTHKMKRRYRRLAFFLVCLLVVIFGVGALLGQVKSIARQDEELKRLQREIDATIAINDELRREISYMKTDEYIKSFAREQLGLLLPGEIRFIDDSGN